MESSWRESEETKWRSAVLDEQMKIARNVGDVTDICTYEVLKSRLAVALFGIPELSRSEMVDTLSYKVYPKSKQEIIVRLANIIFTNQPEKQKVRIFIGFLFIFGKTMDKHPRNFQLCVFRIPDGKGQWRFVDASERVYKDWEDFLTENTLPEATICYPKDGIYSKRNTEILFAETPAAGVKRKVLKGTDIASVVLGAVSSVCMGVSLFVPIAAPITLTALAISSASGIYGMGRSIESLVDRDQHQQTLNLSNSQARSAWLGATLPVFGIAASGGCVFLSAASRAGMTLNAGAKVAINIANGINCAALGINLGNDIYSLVEKNDSPQHVFNLVASALLFTNAIISTHQARMILKSGSENKFFSFFSQPEVFENGMSVRHMNVIDSKVLGFILKGLKMNAAFMFQIPLDVCNKIENIISFVWDCTINRVNPFKQIPKLLSVFKDIWSLINQICKEYAHCKTDEWDMTRKYFADIPGSSHFDVLDAMIYLDNIIKKENKQENDNVGEGNVMEYFTEPNLRKVLEQYKKFNAQSFLHFPVFSTEDAEILYFAYPTACHIDYDQLVREVIDEDHYYSISETENSCSIKFSGPNSKYTVAHVSVQEAHRGFILLKYK